MSYLGRTGKLSQRAYNKLSFLATAGQTVKAGLSYVAGFVEVYVNGTLLTDVVDYSASNGNSVTFLVALSVDDEVTVVSLKTFVAANMLPLSGGTLNGDLSLEDNNKLLIGTGNDLQIYHDGTDSYIKDNGTGYLKLLGTGSVEIGHPSNGHNYIRANYGGDVELYFSNLEKLATTSTGINVTGDVTVSGGVVFGTPSGAASSNTLDDYEEGTWTATFSAGSWGVVDNFTYTKIGRLVHITGHLATPSGLPSGGVLNIGGLPFSGNASYNMAQLWYNSSTTMDAAAYLPGNSYTLSLRPVSGNPSNLLELSVQMTYITNQ
jgi:hypothetical protein